MERKKRQFRWFALLFVFTPLVIFAAGSDNTNEIQWQSIDQICGQIELVQPIRKVIKVNDKTEERLSTAYVVDEEVSLYKAADATTPCCRNAQLVSKAKTGKYGEFHFTKFSAGRYWLLARDRSVPLLVTKQYDYKICKAPEVGRSIMIDAVPYPQVQVRIR